MNRLFLGFLLSFSCGDAMFEVSGTPKDLSFLFRFLVRRVFLCVTVSRPWTANAGLSLWQSHVQVLLLPC